MCQDPYQLSRVLRLPLQPKTEKSLNRSKSIGLLGRQHIVSGKKVEKGCGSKVESRVEIIKAYEATKDSTRDRSR